MNWRLKFTQSSTYVEILDKNKNPIISRQFIGWEKRPMESTILIPKIDLRPGEKLVSRKYNIYIK